MVLASSRANVYQFVGLRIVCFGDIVELATVETSLHCAVELLIGRHVVCDCITVSHRLLDDKVGVTIDCEAGGAACFGHAHAMEQCLVLCFIVGGVAEVDLENVSEFCSFGGD